MKKIFIITAPTSRIASESLSEANQKKLNELAKRILFFDDDAGDGLNTAIFLFKHTGEAGKTALGIVQALLPQPPSSTELSDSDKDNNILIKAIRETFKPATFIIIMDVKNVRGFINNLLMRDNMDYTHVIQGNKLESLDVVSFIPGKENSTIWLKNESRVDGFIGTGNGMDKVVRRVGRSLFGLADKAEKGGIGLLKKIRGGIDDIVNDLEKKK